jgi:hypothetical protein
MMLPKKQYYYTETCRDDIPVTTQNDTINKF